MALIQSDYATGKKPMPAPIGQEVVSILIPLAVTAGQTALGDIYEMGYLPENCALVDAVYTATDIDTNGTPAHAMSFGVVNAAGNDLDTTVEAAIQVGRAGTAARMTPTLASVTTINNDGKTRKKLGYKVTTASATGAAGTVYLAVSYRSTNYGV